jgi:hypothetical protein
MSSASETAKRRWGRCLGSPSEQLNAQEREVWHAIVTVTPPLRLSDSIWLRTCAVMVVDWRHGHQRDLSHLREIYRWLGLGRVPMRARRELLFPDTERRK